MGLVGIAKGRAADAINAHLVPAARPPPFWTRPTEGSFAGGGLSFLGEQDFTLTHPHDGVLDLVVAWPLAGLDDARVRIPLDPA